MAAVTSQVSACSPQLRRLRRPAPAPAPARVRLLLQSPARLRLRAAPESTSDSLAGWSDHHDEDKPQGPLGLGAGGLLGAGLAGVFFLAGVTFAAVSIRSNSGKRAQMHNLSRDGAATESYCHDGSHEENAVEHDQEVFLLSPESAESNKEWSTPLETDQMPGGAADHETGHNIDLVTDGSLNASDGDPSPPSPPASPDSPPSAQVASALSSELDSASPSQGIPILEETSDSRMDLPENQHVDETITTSDAVLLDSDDVVLIQEDSAAVTVSPQKDNDIEENPETRNEGETSSSTSPDYKVYDSADQMLPLGSDDLPTVSNMPRPGEETLAEDLNEGKNELENQNNLFTPTMLVQTSAGIPAPLLSTASQVPIGKIVVPATVDLSQENAVAALQTLKVMDSNVQASDLCTRREYARWLVVASNCLSRSSFSKVYPAMYVDNVTELAFDDVTPEDPDFTFIQGLAEAGLISSKLSRSDMNIPEGLQSSHNLFSPESPLSRQDLVSWKMALDKRQLPQVDRNSLYKASGYIDIAKINEAAWPALAADLTAGDQSITALAFGFTRLFQPDKPVTKGQAALAISTGDSAEVISEELARIEAEKMAEAAVNAHSALVAQVEKDLNANFERELTKEREKVETLEKLAEEARVELDRLRAEREEERNALLRGRAAIESEMEVLSNLRHDVEEQLQSVLSKKVEISFEKNRIEKLQKEIEDGNLAVVQLQYELEVERKALSMARAWAEEEAKKAREHARTLEEARNQWEHQGIKVVVEGFEDDASAGVTWANAGKEHPVDETINGAESLLEKLKLMSAEMKVRSRAVLDRVIEHLKFFIASLKQHAAHVGQQCSEFGAAAASEGKRWSAGVQGSICTFGSTIGDKSKRVMEDCKEGLDKFMHRFKTD